MRNDSNDSPDSARHDADIDVLTDYLAGELPPERVAEVRWRLEMDVEFREFAAPLIWFWNGSRRIRRSKAREENERHWAELCKRLGVRVTRSSTMTDDSDDDIDAPVDPDIALLTDYLANGLSPGPQDATAPSASNPEASRFQTSKLP